MSSTGAQVSLNNLHFHLLLVHTFYFILKLFLFHCNKIGQVYIIWLQITTLKRGQGEPTLKLITWMKFISDHV
jgi:hypothetical protein